MTRSELIKGLPVIAFALALGSWSSIVVADKYQRSDQVIRPTGLDPASARCTTLEGKTFEWAFANVPFGAASCSWDQVRTAR